MGTAPITLATRQANAGFPSNERSRSVVPAKLLGLAIATLVPASFWTYAAWAIGNAFGFEIATNTLLMIAASITLFLSFVCSALLATD